MCHDDRTLLDYAWSVREHAHAPYSNFKVGAAIVTNDGTIVYGCNIENAAYPEGMCAEAAAIAMMFSYGRSGIAKIAIVADSDEPVTPCGGCRQKLAEFAGMDVPVIMASKNETRKMTVGELLPGAFSLGNGDEK